MEMVLSSGELRAIALEAHYYRQTSDGRTYQSDVELREKRERLLATVERYGFRLEEELLSTEGPVRYAHLVFHRV
jgi:hypothetical protein